ncbi:MAG: hypothetical protein E6L08_14550 [Verrucomicrobia bacterium]|nr:MAG: hypothetical protein E6L08_14550 [Verrucomicrobiota bacterium]
MPRTVNSNLNKQFLRISLSPQREARLEQNTPAPKLPREVTKKTSTKYLEALRRLTGHKLAHRRARKMMAMATCSCRSSNST